MQPGLISSQYFLLLLSNSNIALLLTHSWEMQHNGWIVMQLGRLEFQHIAVLHRIALPALVVHGGSLSIVELQPIALHCGIAMYYVALWNTQPGAFFSIVNRSSGILRRCSRLHCIEVEHSYLATQHLLWWQQAQWCWTRRLTRRSTWCWTSSSSSTFPPWCFRMGSVCWSTSGLILSNRRSCPSSSNW